MWYLVIAALFVVCSPLQSEASKDSPLDLTHDEENGPAKKMQHWYRHQCWRAIETFYQARKGEMDQQDLAACAPIMAQAYCSQGNYAAAEAIAKNFLQSPQTTLASAQQNNAMHAIALKCAAQRNDWKTAEVHYKVLLKSDNLTSLPLWVRYTLADTALQLDDTKRALAILTPCYAGASNDNPLYPQITFLLAITHMRLNNPKEAYNLFVECNGLPNAKQLAGLAAKGRVQATSEQLKEAGNKTKNFLERQLLSDLQSLLDDHSSLTEAEKSSALRQQAQLLAQLLRHDEANEKLNKVLDMASSPQERAQIHLQIAFNSFISKKDANAFHYNARQALNLDPNIATLKSLRLALFHIYDKLSETDPSWTLSSAEHLAAAYPSLNTTLAQPHQSSGKRLADALYNTLSQPPTLDQCLFCTPKKEQEQARLAAHLYANLGETEKSIALYAGLVDIPKLEALAPAIKTPALRDRYNAILAYLYTRSGDYTQACARAALAMASQDKITSTLATLSYASAGWRSLAQEHNPHPDDYLHLLELLAQLQESRRPETEPWHIEGAFEYILASAYLLRNEPKAEEQNILLIDRAYAKYFDHESHEGQNYWSEIKKQPQLQLLMERYAALFNAKSARLRAILAEKNGQHDDMLDWDRKSEEYYRTALGNSSQITPFLIAETPKVAIEINN